MFIVFTKKPFEFTVNVIWTKYLIEDGNIIDVPKELIPGAKEGDIVDIYINKDEREKKEEEVKKLMDDLFVD